MSRIRSPEPWGTDLDIPEAVFGECERAIDCAIDAQTRAQITDDCRRYVEEHKGFKGGPFSSEVRTYLETLSRLTEGLRTHLYGGLPDPIIAAAAHELLDEHMVTMFREKSQVRDLSLPLAHLWKAADQLLSEPSPKGRSPDESFDRFVQRLSKRVQLLDIRPTTRSKVDETLTPFVLFVRALFGVDELYKLRPMDDEALRRAIARSLKKVTRTE